MNIKKGFTILAAIIAMQLNAQQPVTPDYAKDLSNFNYGFKAGANFSSQQFSPNQNFIEGVNINNSSLTSFHVGFFAGFKLSEKIGLNTEIIYSKEGSKVSLENPFLAISFKQKLDYLRIPVLLDFNPFSNGISFHLGPQIGFILKDHITLDNNDGDPGIDSDFKSFDLSAVIGAELQLSKKFIIGARYNLGLSDISKTGEAKYKNKNLQCYLKYTIFN